MPKLIKRNPDGSLPPGHYTRENLPPLSPEAQEISNRIYEEAERWRKSPEGKAVRARAREAGKTGGLAAYIGVILGTKGSE